MNMVPSASFTTCFIRCGLEHDILLYTEQKKLFWPVAKAIPLPVLVDKALFAEPFVLIFSSKTAVQFFFENIYNIEKTLFKNCRKIYCVGRQTKEFFQKTFEHLQYPDICFSEKMGIQNVLDEFNLTISQEKLYFCIAAEGKTRKIVENTNFKSAHQMIFLYKLTAYKSDFLYKFFEVNGKFNAQIEYWFECYSGQIYQYTAEFLLDYFNCNAIVQLPTNIKISAIGASTIEKERQFYEQHRS